MFCLGMAFLALTITHNHIQNHVLLNYVKLLSIKISCNSILLERNYCLGVCFFLIKIIIKQQQHKQDVYLYPPNNTQCIIP